MNIGGTLVSYWWVLGFQKAVRHTATTDWCVLGQWRVTATISASTWSTYTWRERTLLIKNFCSLKRRTTAKTKSLHDICFSFLSLYWLKWLNVVLCDMIYRSFNDKIYISPFFFYLGNMSFLAPFPATFPGTYYQELIYLMKIPGNLCGLYFCCTSEFQKMYST